MRNDKETSECAKVLINGQGRSIMNKKWLINEQEIVRRYKSQQEISLKEEVST